MKKNLSQFVIDHVDIAAVLKKRLRIWYVRGASREVVALCPFHREKTPSLRTYRRDKQVHCFGCGHHSNAIGFIEEYEHIDREEAINMLMDEFKLWTKWRRERKK